MLLKYPVEKQKALRKKYNELWVKTQFSIKKFDFDSSLVSEFNNIHYVKDLWPVVYILSDGNVNSYVGETNIC
jgi:hypothetical protein